MKKLILILCTLLISSCSKKDNIAGTTNETDTGNKIALTGSGQVLMNLQDPAARLPSVTAVLETRRALYLATLFGSSIARLDKRDLQ